MKSKISKLTGLVPSLAFIAALAGCVAAAPPQIDDCPGDSVLINGECIGVDEDGNPK